MDGSGGRYIGGVRDEARRGQLERCSEEFGAGSLWEELQIKVGEPSEAQSEEGFLLCWGGEGDSRAACQIGQQMGSHGRSGTLVSVSVSAIFNLFLFYIFLDFIFCSIVSIHSLDYLNFSWVWTFPANFFFPPCCVFLALVWLLRKWIQVFGFCFFSPSSTIVCFVCLQIEVFTLIEWNDVIRLIWVGGWGSWFKILIQFLSYQAEQIFLLLSFFFLLSAWVRIPICNFYSLPRHCSEINTITSRSCNFLFLWFISVMFLSM